MDSLDIIIESHPIEELRRLYKAELLDWADTDTEVRELASKVLTDMEVNGDSYGVPTIEDIVETLVMKIMEK